MTLGFLCPLGHIILTGHKSLKGALSKMVKTTIKFEFKESKR